MSLIDIACVLEYQIHRETSFQFKIAAIETEHQTITREKCLMAPETEVGFITSSDGLQRLLRLEAAPGDLRLEYTACVRLTPAIDHTNGIRECRIQDLPDDVLPYLNPSRYCESDRLARMAIQTFGEIEPGYGRVIAICDWTFNHLVYESGSTDERSSAADVLVQCAGVCRDYAHLAIALCRALCIPARYVAGYAVGLMPPDFHGFFEAYLDGEWYLFDATKMVPRNGLVRIGTGRDAADISFAHIIGQAMLTRMEISVSEITDTIDQKNADSEPGVSTA